EKLAFQERLGAENVGVAGLKQVAALSLVVIGSWREARIGEHVAETCRVRGQVEDHGVVRARLPCQLELEVVAIPAAHAVVEYGADILLPVLEGRKVPEVVLHDGTP